MITDIKRLRLRYVKENDEEKAREDAQTVAQLQARSILRAAAAEGRKKGLKEAEIPLEDSCLPRLSVSVNTA